MASWAQVFFVLRFQFPLFSNMASDTGSIGILKPEITLRQQKSVDRCQKQMSLKAAADAGSARMISTESAMAVRECMVNAVVHGSQYSRTKTSRESD